MEYTNDDLARDYFRVAAQYCGSVDSYVNQQKVIRTASQDLPAFYEANQYIPPTAGLTRETVKMLELILKEGVKTAKEIVAQKRIDDLHTEKITREWQHAHDKRRSNEALFESWDNVVKAYEDE